MPVDESKQKNLKSKRGHLNRTIFATLIFLAITLSTLLAIGEYAKPPEGFFFEKLPVVTGVYHYNGSGRSSESWVGEVRVKCDRFNFYGKADNWTDCGFKDQLQGKVVEVIQAKSPSFSGEVTNVIRMTVGHTVLINITDTQLRERWVREMRDTATLNALLLALLFNGALQIFFTVRKKNIQ